MAFHKGQTAWNKGKKLKPLSEEHKTKLREANKGKRHSKETKLKMSKVRKGKNNSMYGKKHTKEAIEKMRIIKLGNKNTLGYKHTEKAKLKISKWRKGKSLSEETKRKIGKSLKGKRMGEESPVWNGGSRRYYQNVAFRVWEDYWDQEMPKGYCLHHIDEDYKNSDICNIPMITPSLHEKIHLRNSNRDSITGRFQ